MPDTMPPLLQLGVFLTAIAGAVATVIGAVSASRSKRAAAASTAEAADAAKKHATVEERIVNKDEFAEVVDGLRAIITTQGDQIRGLERRVKARDAEVARLRSDVQECHNEKREDKLRYRERLAQLEGSQDDT